MVSRWNRKGFSKESFAEVSVDMEAKSLDAKVDSLGFEQNISNEDVENVENVRSDPLELDILRYESLSLSLCV